MSDPAIAIIAPADARPIEGWPGYAISADGTAWSQHRPNGGLGGQWRKLAPFADRDQYPRINLRDGARYRQFTVHALVLTAFVGPCPEGQQARHLDNDRSNPALFDAEGNLRLSWGTVAQNANDRRLAGTTPVGERNPSARIDEPVALRILQMKADGLETREIAESVGASASIVRRCGRETWTHLALSA